jgi:hypothetical protein
MRIGYTEIADFPFVAQRAFKFGPPRKIQPQAQRRRALSECLKTKSPRIVTCQRLQRHLAGVRRVFAKPGYRHVYAFRDTPADNVRWRIKTGEFGRLFQQSTGTGRYGVGSRNSNKQVDETDRRTIQEGYCHYLAGPA